VLAEETSRSLDEKREDELIRGNDLSRPIAESSGWRTARAGAIKDLEEARSSHVITYITSTRLGFEAEMKLDVIPLIHKHLRTLPKDDRKRIDLFIHSNGGDGVVPWRMVTLIREFCEEFCVLVPNRAFSAATLTALGADEVVMHPMGMLGPTDPTVANEFNPTNPRNPSQKLGISVEDVSSYIALVKEDIGIGHEDELVQAFLALTSQVHPLALGNVKRSTSQSRVMGEKLLRTRKLAPLSDHEVDQIITRLFTAELFYHGHPINRNEAREELGLSFVVNAAPQVEDAMWKLFCLYDAEMQFNAEFKAIDEAVAAGGLPDIPPPDAPPTVQPETLGPLPRVVVESVNRSDVMESTYQVTLRREWTGSLEAEWVRAARGWRSEGQDGEPSGAS
jgi:hypothetical protein